MPTTADNRAGYGQQRWLDSNMERAAHIPARLLTAERVRRYPRVLFAATMIMFLVGLLRAHDWIEPSGQVIGRDFLAFYMAGVMVHDGRLAELYDLHAQETWQQQFMAPVNPAWSGTCLYLNPPHYAWAMSAFAPLGYGGALIAWWVISLSFFAATVAIWRKWLNADPKRDRKGAESPSRDCQGADEQVRRCESEKGSTRTRVDTTNATCNERENNAPLTWRDIAILAACMPAWFQAFAGGQNSFISLLVLTGFCALLMRGRDLLAGLVLALLAFKFQLLLVPILLLIWKRRWSALAGVALGGIATLALTVAVLGVDAIANYLHFAGRLGSLLQINGFDVYKQHSWHGFFALAGMGWLSPATIRALTAVASLATLVVLVRIWRTPWTHARLPFILSATMVANLLISPHLFHYDLLIITLPAVLWVVASRKSQTIAASPLAPLLAIGFVWLCISPMIADVIRVQLSPWLMLAWLVVALRVARAYAAGDSIAQTSSTQTPKQRADHEPANVTLEPA